MPHLRPSLTGLLLVAIALQTTVIGLAASGGAQLLGCHWAAVGPRENTFCAAGAWPTAFLPWVLTAVLTCGGVALAGGELQAGLRSVRRSSRLIATLDHLRVPSTSRLARCNDVASAVPVDQIDIPRPVALCHGLLRPRIIISTGLIETLDDEALSAVLAHETAHARRHDPLRLLALRVGTVAASLFPIIRPLAAHVRAETEWAADRYAADRCGTAALARALHTILSHDDHDPGHPDLPGFCSIAARVRLLGRTEAPRPHLAPWQAIASVAVAGLLATVATWMWHVSQHTAVITDLQVS